MRVFTVVMPDGLDPGHYAYQCANRSIHAATLHNELQSDKITE